MLTVIMGGMYSEKSTELLRRGKRLERAGKRVVYIKPDFDNRYSEDQIVTHDGNSVDCINIPVAEPDKILDVGNDYEVFCIDETQFFDDEKIMGVANVLANHGRQVIVAGLDLAHDGTVFMGMACLASSAEVVVKLNAVCATCGGDSWITEKTSGSTDRVELGSEDKYRPICRRCRAIKQIEQQEEEHEEK